MLRPRALANRHTGWLGTGDGAVIAFALAAAFTFVGSPSATAGDLRGTGPVGQPPTPQAAARSAPGGVNQGSAPGSEFTAQAPDIRVSDARAMVSGDDTLLRFNITPTALGATLDATPAASARDNAKGAAGPIAGTGTGPVAGLLYFTPRTPSFDLGLSHKGEACKFISPEISGASCYALEPGGGGQAAGVPPGDKFAFGVAYQKRVKAVDLGVSTTVVSGAKEPDGLSPITPGARSWKLGFSADYTGFTFRTSFFKDRARANRQRNQLSGVGGQKVFDLGVKYDQGPWKFGAQYRHSKLDSLSIGPDLGNQKVDAYEIGGSYLMGPRLSLGAAIQFWKWGEFAGAAAEEDQKKDLLFLIGSHLKF